MKKCVVSMLAVLMFMALLPIGTLYASTEEYGNMQELAEQGASQALPVSSQPEAPMPQDKTEPIPAQSAPLTVSSLPPTSLAPDENIVETGDMTAAAGATQTVMEAGPMAGR